MVWMNRVANGPVTKGMSRRANGGTAFFAMNAFAGFVSRRRLDCLKPTLKRASSSGMTTTGGGQTRFGVVRTTNRRTNTHTIFWLVNFDP
jgi:hypothetical protein